MNAIKDSETLQHDMIRATFEKLVLGAIIAVCLVVYSCREKREVRAYQETQSAIVEQISKAQLLADVFVFISDAKYDASTRGVLFHHALRTTALDAYTALTITRNMYHQGMQLHTYVEIIDELDPIDIDSLIRIGIDIGTAMEKNKIAPINMSEREGYISAYNDSIERYLAEQELLGERTLKVLGDQSKSRIALENWGHDLFGLFVLLYPISCDHLSKLTSKDSEIRLRLIANTALFIRESLEKNSFQNELDRVSEVESPEYRISLIFSLLKILYWSGVQYSVPADFTRITIEGAPDGPAIPYHIKNCRN